MAMQGQCEKSEHDENLPIYRPDGRSLGVALSHVTVFGPGGASAVVLDLQSILQGILGYPVHALRNAFGKRRGSLSKIVYDISAVVNPGDNLLVLGRPGAGCSSVLKLMGNSTDSFAAIQGDIAFGTLTPSEISSRYGSEVVYVAEDDMHYPRLSVENTLQFGLRLRRPKDKEVSQSEFMETMTNSILSSLGMLHTKKTIVGDAFVRGVSGGERRRVSLAEALLVNPAITCWDNPIRGLDSSSALNFLSLLKKMSRKTGMSNIVTLYQASERMYQECFDSVIVLYEGRMIFFGKAIEAKEYFINLGFYCHPRQTTPDFLTTVTSPTERRLRDGFHGRVPLDPDSMAETFRQSKHYKQLEQDIQSYHATQHQNGATIRAFVAESERVRSKFVPSRLTEVSSLWKQTIVAARRYYQILWADKVTLFTVVTLNLANALINASSYFKVPKTSTGSFERGGALFFAIIYFFLNALAEVTTTIRARQILLKQHKLGLIHPVSYIFASTLCDIPFAFIQTLIFACCYYFIIGLSETAAAFWIFVFVVFIHYSAASALFRMLGAWSPNLSIGLLMAGSGMPVCLLYSGYAPTLPTQPKWGSWIRRIAPSPWALEALMANEFTDITLHCTDSQLIPNGPGYGDLQYQGCTLPRSTIGDRFVPGSEYLSTVYNFSRSHLWRNVGIIIAIWCIYTILAAIGLVVTTRETSQSGGRVYKRGTRFPQTQDRGSDPQVDQYDVEKQVENRYEPTTLMPISSNSSITQVDQIRDANEEVKGEQNQSAFPNGKPFTFSNVSYFVQVNGQEKQLLNGVAGYVRPGQLTALMGASGAGKTTLLDNLSQRKTDGRIEGEMLFGGRPLDASFARSCGFCLQQDVHEANSTVREALMFSAHLRQEDHISEQDKNAYVEHIITLLELEPIADALIGYPGDGGLGVEERKRITIGVELAAKPSGLLFLDEPTSGLDSQAAFSIVTFLQKIAAEGVPIVCTIHQPSGVLFDMFDHILLLAPGGKTVYFGEAGYQSQTVVSYFARYGAIMDSSANPAEFILATATQTDEGSQDWNQVWRESPEATQLHRKIEELNHMAATNPTTDSSVAVASRKQYARSIQTQITFLTKRHWISVWRNGPYNFSRLFKAIFCELFIAFSFFMVGTDVQGLQNHMLGILLLSWIIPATAADIQDVWFEKWALFEARERNGIYDYKALLVALIVVEIPWQIFTYTIVFFCSYWTLGFSNESTISGYVYLMYLLLSLFGIGFPQLIATIFPNGTMSGYANSLFWVILMIFSGTAIPHSAFVGFYKPWLFWADPMRYFFGGTVASVLHGVQAHCSESDLTTFNPPPSQTCAEYMSGFLSTNSGYLVNGNATSLCQYCRYSVGDDYANSIEFFYGDRWRDFAVFLAFCCSTFFLCFVVTWFTRIRGRQSKAS
ncbi:hypothetical protein BP6252_12018 [Coleophoma cylindrospora]|uniref:ABC transporter domain-containing protein n=1 Tax=Coleophoma cylindrospora TaxID=1849047 RepID=A0A3D8QFQ9_9HELO|nr:hypothetical protein BP6252_12018 [Coleophoma cylindrospora]